MNAMQSLGDRHEVELPQGTLTYSERGEGPPVVFIHGLLVNANIWRKVVPEVAGGARCLCPELPLGAHPAGLSAGADLSPTGIADLIRDFLDALGVERATFVGNDTGGGLVQIFAAHFPERVEQIVLTNCDCYEEFPPLRSVRALLRVAHLPGLARLIVWQLAQLQRSRRVLRLAFVPFVEDASTIEDAVLDSYGRPSRRRDVRRDVTKFLLAMDNRYTLEAARKLRTFERPVLLAWGTDDRIFSLSLAERLANDLPNAQIVPIEGARTFVPEDGPQELARLISERVRQPATAIG